MRRFLFLALLVASLAAPQAGHAQYSGDPGNKLSLEALTARPPGGGGYEGRPRTSYRRPAYRASRGRAYGHTSRYHAIRPTPHYRARGNAIRHARPTPARHGGYHR